MASEKPYWILRHHSPSSVHHVTAHPNGQLIAAGDAQGKVSVTSLADFRPRVFWKAHDDSILGVKLIDDYCLTHGRDNNLCLWQLPPLSVSSSQPGTTSAELPSRLISSLPQPTLLKKVPVNALNFCRFGFWQTSKPGQPTEALVAVPHTLDAAWFDILQLPSGRRLHEAVSKPDIIPQPGHRQAIIMSLHVIKPKGASRISCIAGYEDGFVRQWQEAQDNRSWSLLWERKLHSESVMQLAISDDFTFGVSVAADDRIAKFSLTDRGRTATIVETRKAGNAAVAISRDGNSLAVSGWDGNIRLFTCTDLSPTRTLRYHKETVESVLFLSPVNTGGMSDHESSESESEDSLACKKQVSRLLGAGRDGKISLWTLS